MNGLNEPQQRQFMQHLQTMQIKDSLRMYNDLNDKCFAVCVKPTGGGWVSGPQGFKSKKLDGAEEKCIEECAAKFIKLTQRVGLRFAENQQAQQAGSS
mmetsp:Transcript_28966/g.52336  ORF Transcript_28966/g.52336 Transcript_28966/m.52336 type:complete len:98 (+) Transcript_28966:1-294(+)